MDSSMSVADYLAIADRNGTRDGVWGGNAGFLWVILIFLFFLAFSGGFGGFGFGRGNFNGYTQVQDTGVNRSLDQIERDVLQTSCNTEKAILTTSCGTQKEILENRYATQLGFQAAQAQLSECCCDLKTAIHSEGEQTRALITQNTIQDLRDQVNGFQTTLSNANQTQSILSALGQWYAHPPVNPYAAFGYGYGYGYNGYGRNCGGCGGCGGCGNGNY